MYIEYNNEPLKKLFEDSTYQYRELEKKVGAKICKSLSTRLTQLQAANNFFQYLTLKVGKPHSLSGNMCCCYSISVTANYRLIVKPVSENLSPEALKKCDTIILKGVVDYHDGKSNWIIR